MRRFVSAIAFVAALAVALGAAGCGQRFDREPGRSPAPGELAADALAALEVEGSAHFVADVKSGAAAGELPFELSLHAEGDASRTTLDAEASVSFGGATFQGHVLVGEHDFFVQFMNQWYGFDQGLVEAMREAKAEDGGRAWDELATAEGLRRNFDDLFDGEVNEGPVVDGLATWQFEGKLDAQGVLDLARRLGVESTDREEEMLRKVADATRLVLVVGQKDRLPRRLEFTVELSADELSEMESSDSPVFGGAENFKASLELSEFGKPVEIRAPADFKPLDELFEQFFSGFG